MKFFILTYFCDVKIKNNYHSEIQKDFYFNPIFIWTNYKIYYFYFEENLV